MWVPQTATVSFKPCLLSASNGYFVNILRVRRKVSFRGTDMRVLYCDSVSVSPSLGRELRALEDALLQK
jgi:hypothetical protein